MWILSAVTEELFFRFFLLRQCFLRNLKPTLAIVLVSALFAGMHLLNLRAGQAIGQTLLQMGYAFAFSIWAGAVTWKSTWLVPLIAHVLLNLTATESSIVWGNLVISAIILLDGVVVLKGVGVIRDGSNSAMRERNGKKRYAH